MPLVYAMVGRADAPSPVAAAAAGVGALHDGGAAATPPPPPPPQLLVLAQHTCGGVDGSLDAVAAECFASFGGEERFSVAVDGYSFNFLTTHGGLVFAVAADEAFGRELPFAAAKCLADAFVPSFAERAAKARARLALQKRAGPLLAAQLARGNARPQELYQIALQQQQVADVKGILIANLDWLEGAVAPAMAAAEAAAAAGKGGGGGGGGGGGYCYDIEAAAYASPAEAAAAAALAQWRRRRLSCILLGAAAALALLVVAACLGACYGSGRCGRVQESS